MKKRHKIEVPWCHFPRTAKKRIMTQQLRQLRAMSAQSNKAPSGAYKKATPAMLLRQEAERLKLLEQVPLAEAMIWGLQFAAAKLDLMSGDAPEYVGLRYKLICEEVPQ